MIKIFAKYFIILLIAFLMPLTCLPQEQPADDITADTENTVPGDMEVDDISVEKPPPSVKAPSEATAADNPNDEGYKIRVSWKLAPGDTATQEDNPVSGYEIYRSGSPDGEFEMADYTAWGVNTFVDNVENDTPYYYKIRTRADDGSFSGFSPVTAEPATASGQWFDTDSINGAVAIVLFVGFLFIFLNLAKKEASLFIRRIAGLDALDEAVGRATEMGKPILFVPGLSSIADVATIAALNILGPVAKKVAEYESEIIVPNRDPIVFTVAQEVVQEAFLEAGRPDAYHDDMVFFLTDSQFGYAAAVDGLMVREKPATNLFLGMFWAESLILAETGNMTGAIQIAGTDSVTQLPFFVTACDYTIIGEELYAASAYLSRQPLLVASLKAQDFVKLIILIFMIAGFIPTVVNTVFEWFNPEVGTIGFLSTFIDYLRAAFNV